MSISDYNRDGSAASRIARSSLYSDIPTTFNIHPIYDDIKPITDINAIKQSVRNLVLTNLFERPFQPDVGSNITALLFENADNFTARAIAREIERVLDKYEPRIGNINVEVEDQRDRNAYAVTISYVVRASNTREDTQIYLIRQR